MSLKNKRILITAGPTWVPIDSVRVISNIATGKTGILLAQELTKIGTKVTLVLGPVSNTVGGLSNRIRVLRFKFFDDLRNILKKELSARKYSIVIHSAAVSDFKPVSLIKGKLDSGNTYNLKLVPLPKIIKDIRVLNPKGKLIMFKLESGIPDNAFIKLAREYLNTYKADLVIANRLTPYYKAFILDSHTVYSQVNSKEELVKDLISSIKIKNY